MNRRARIATDKADISALNIIRLVPGQSVSSFFKKIFWVKTPASDLNKVFSRLLKSLKFLNSIAQFYGIWYILISGKPVSRSLFYK